MTVRVYNSSDASAPVLTGTTAGALIAILDACLVNGYGAKVAAGWTKEFSGTNLAAYKMGAGMTDHYLRVDDTATGSSRAARLTGFESMTGISTGVNQFPSNAQFAGGLYAPTVQGTTAIVGRTWIVVADEWFVYVWLDGDGDMTVNQYFKGFYQFGAYVPYKTGGDPYATCIFAQNSPTMSSSQGYGFECIGTFAGMEQMYCPRPYTGLGSSYKVGRHVDTVKVGNTNQTSGQSGAMSYPHPIDGGLYLSPVWVHETGSANIVRGHFPGLWGICHTNLSLATGDEWDGTGALAGKRFMLVRNYTSMVAIEISNTWR